MSTEWDGDGLDRAAGGGGGDGLDAGASVVADLPGRYRPQGGGARLYDWLFLDLNSYFASVEQQERPETRGRPTVVVPVMTEHTCAIAASYEAKALGIKTGTGIREALGKCPDLIRVMARHDVYVDYHHRIVDEVERHMPVTQVASIDEMACRLTGRLRRLDEALALARRIKAGLAERIGAHVRCSIGIATNRYLAKVATDLEKPDGLVALHAEDLPGPLLGLALTDFPGISTNREKRLNRVGIHTTADLWACGPKRLRAAWGSVNGERFWYALRGIEIPDDPTNRSTVGHSHVLDPDQRPPALAEHVGRRLLLKAAGRLRAMDHQAAEMTLSVRLEDGRRFEQGARFPALSDSITLQEAFTALWHLLVRRTGDARMKKVSVTLHRLRPAGADVQLDLFERPDDPSAPPPHAQARRARVSQAIDVLTERFGRDAVTVGIIPGQGSSFTGTKIAFTRIPGRGEFEKPRDTRPAP